MMHWNPIEWTFLMGTKSPNSTIQHAFGAHPLSEKQLIRLIFDFQEIWPEELRTFQPRKGFDRNAEGDRLPVIQEDGRALILYKEQYSDDCPTSYSTVEVVYDFTMEYPYEVCLSDNEYREIDDRFDGYAFYYEFKTLSEALKKIKY